MASLIVTLGWGDFDGIPVIRAMRKTGRGIIVDKCRNDGPFGRSKPHICGPRDESVALIVRFDCLCPKMTRRTRGPELHTESGRLVRP